MAFKEKLTQEQFEELHEILDKTKSKVVRKVPRDALANLLQDYAELVEMHLSKERGYKMLQRAGE